MKESDIRKYANLMYELGLSALEIRDGNKSARLERPVPNTISKESVVITAQAQPNLLSTEQTQGNSDYISIKSMFVGVFYAAPAENAAPFVNVGDRTEKGKTLCIIEAMKMMNEICAEESGTIIKICVSNGQVVEYGTELFRIKR